MNTKNSGIRFNLIDITLVLVLLCLLGGTLLRLGVDFRKPEEPELSEAEISFLLSSLPATMQDGIAQGDEVFLGETKLGTLKTADFSRAAAVSANSEGKPVVSYSNTSFDVRCIVSGKGTQTEDGFLAGGTLSLAAGMTVTLRTRSMTVEALVTDITVIG